MRQTPSFMSVSQWAAMSIPPARAPVGDEDGFEEEEIMFTENIVHHQIFVFVLVFCAT